MAKIPASVVKNVDWAALARLLEINFLKLGIERQVLLEDVQVVNGKLVLESQSLLFATGIFRVGLRKASIQNFGAEWDAKRKSLCFKVVIQYEMLNGGQNGVDIGTAYWNYDGHRDWMFHSERERRG